ncbi:MAG: hypothetical protein ABEN55_13430 [Bradymonadaceae bacterium]
MADDKTTDIDLLAECVGGLTIQPPWPQTIVFGPKRIENRTWRPPDKIRGGRIAVGVSQSKDDDAWAAAIVGHDDPWGEYGPMPVDGDLDRNERQDVILERHHPGHIIGTVQIVGWCHPEEGRGMCIGKTKKCGIEKVGKWTEHAHKIRDGGEFGRPEYDNDLVTSDPWYAGPIAWLLDDPQPLDEPVPVRGMPGIWGVQTQIGKAREAQS